MLQNGKLNIIKDLEEQFNENIYLIPTKSAQKKLLQHGTKNRADELFKVSQGSHVLFNNTLFKDETLIIIESDIIEFKDILTMY
jgi:hypothetical protein